jgi:hypothetical protein
VKDLIIRVSITVLDVVPVIWRRIEVPADVTLEGLHDVIQVVMGWADYHLHHFRIGNLRYSAPTPNDVDMQDGGKLKLSTLVVDGERAFEYVYDYGDDWRCVVVLEAIAPMIRGLAYPRLVEGARRGPPRMSAVPGAITSSWRPSQILSTSVTQNCSNGEEATSTHSS